LNQYTSIGSQTPVPGYDPDGNMTTNGAWLYTWDGENRLLTASNTTTTVAITNRYDHMSRRVAKLTATTTNVFLYDGWNMVRETLTSDL
jgi:hypothetical protein